jgi:hypothetical protein
MQTENLSIIHNYDGCSFERHYIDPNIPDGFVLTKEQRYRLQCYYTESGFSLLCTYFEIKTHLRIIFNTITIVGNPLLDLVWNNKLIESRFKCVYQSRMKVLQEFPSLSRSLCGLNQVSSPMYSMLHGFGSCKSFSSRTGALKPG